MFCSSAPCSCYHNQIHATYPVASPWDVVCNIYETFQLKYTLSNSDININMCYQMIQISIADIFTSKSCGNVLSCCEFLPSQPCHCRKWLHGKAISNLHLPYLHCKWLHKWYPLQYLYYSIHHSCQGKAWTSTVKDLYFFSSSSAKFTLPDAMANKISNENH